MGSQATEYIVIDVEHTGLYYGNLRQAELTLAKASELGNLLVFFFPFLALDFLCAAFDVLMLRTFDRGV